MDKDTTKKRILEKIESGDIHMKSRLHFVTKEILFASVFTLSIIAILFLISFIGFSLHNNGTLLLSSFGGRGVGPLIFALPWLLIIVVIVLLIILELLSRRFTFVYRKPLAYSVVGIVIVSIFAGGVIAASPLHRNALEIIEKRNIAIGETFYKRYESPRFRDGTYAGEIISIEGSEIILQTHTGEELRVSTSTRTRFPIGKELNEGDLVLIVGEKTEDTFEAFGIRPLHKEGLRDSIPALRKMKGEHFENRFNGSSTKANTQ